MSFYPRTSTKKYQEINFLPKISGDLLEFSSPEDGLITNCIAHNHTFCSSEDRKTPILKLDFHPQTSLLPLILSATEK